MVKHFARLIKFRIKQIFKSILIWINPRLFPSHSYKLIENEAILTASEKLKDAWKAHEISVLQNTLVEKELYDFYHGKKNATFEAYCNAVKTFGRFGTLLEIGCSSGYYSEILKYKNLRYDYYGCDYSTSFIKLATQKYPELIFSVQDSTNLAFQDNFFDVVVSGCCILHIYDYERAIEETIRVAKAGVVFHKTPILNQQKTKFYTKKAYGQETVEIHFNEKELIDLFKSFGLNIINKIELNSIYDTQMNIIGGHVTYVCRKNV